MASAGRPRRDLLVRFALEGPPPRVDVGADHGRVAAAIGAIATEIQDHARAPGIDWVVTDGLDCFRALGTVVIAGMGARSIARILARGPSVRRAVLHAQDDPCALRTWLAENGWRIVDEGLAREAGRFAEVVVAEPGAEPATGLALEYGPRLLEGHDPHVREHLAQLVGHLERLERQSRPSPSAHADHVRRLGFVRERLAALGTPRDA
ncbi:MAG: tRNA (adenine(22)-N(1))-methyltransferase TrmK [Alphaproteobacteria bacterium]|nr:tRNA (adenine(22)-N(1))-methyltransferase TrmK [Alphaproteobacteria bacterium]